jgi:hypothetical protein
MDGYGQSRALDCDRRGQKRKSARRPAVRGGPMSRLEGHPVQAPRRVDGQMALRLGLPGPINGGLQSRADLVGDCLLRASVPSFCSLRACGCEEDVVLRRQLRVRLRLQVRQRLRRVSLAPSLPSRSSLSESDLMMNLHAYG